MLPQRKGKKRGERGMERYYREIVSALAKKSTPIRNEGAIQKGNGRRVPGKE